MKTRWSLALAAAAALAAGCLGAAWARLPRSGGDAATCHTGPTVEQVQALSSLVTARVEVADVLETHVDGLTGGMSVALLVRGDYLLGVDLARARFESVDRSAHTAVVVLPQPRVTSPRLDHERTRVFLVAQSGLWQLAPGGGQTSGELADRGFRDAQRVVAAAGGDPAVAERARLQAEQVLGAFFRATGWTVRVRWEP